MVPAGQLNLRHVARRAAAGRHLAGPRFWLAARMTGLALGVVIGCFGVYILMRVVAGKATDSGIIRVIAPAARQSIRLEPDIGDVQLARQCDFLPRAVTLSAKSGNLISGESAQMLHCAHFHVGLL